MVVLKLIIVAEVSIMVAEVEKMAEEVFNMDGAEGDRVVIVRGGAGYESI